MKSTIKKIKQQQTIQPTKITKNRITALLLALLLVTTVLSPIIPVKAQDTAIQGADMTESNGNGNSSDAPTVTTNPDGTRTLKFSQSFYLVNDDGSFLMSQGHAYTVTGLGKFVIVGYYNSIESDHNIDFRSFLLSDKTFTGKDVRRITSNGTISDDTFDMSCTFYKDVYYVPLLSLYSSRPNKNCYTSGLMNERKTDYSNFIDALKADIDNGRIDLSVDNYKEPDLEKDGTYSKDIPTPKISVNSDYTFSCDNSTDDYYIQLQGRFWSIDDIELYKEHRMWKYKYESYIKGSLNTWYFAEDKIKASSNDLSFLNGGQTHFDNFLREHPVDERNYYGGTNALGNYFSGYNDAINTIKTLLKIPVSGYNGVEVYVRYFTYDKNNNLIYGKWCHYYDSLAKNGSSGSEWDDDDTLHDGSQSEDGLTDDEKDDNEKQDDPRNDPDTNIPSPDDDIDEYVPVSFDSIISILTSLRSTGNGILGLFSSVFNFLPTWLTSLIFVSFATTCMLGLWKMFKG